MEKSGNAFEAQRTELLAETSASEISVHHENWRHFEAVTLRLPNDCSIESMMERETEDGDRIYNPVILRVNPKLRGQSLGKRLLQASLAYAIDHGATEMRSLVVNEQSLLILRDLLGEDHLQYKEINRKTKLLEDVSAGFQDAYDYIDGAKPYEVNLEDREYGVEVWADLTRVDVRDWERPTLEAPRDDPADETDELAA